MKMLGWIGGSYLRRTGWYVHVQDPTQSNLLVRSLLLDHRCSSETILDSTILRFQLKSYTKIMKSSSTPEIKSMPTVDSNIRGLDCHTVTLDTLSLHQHTRVVR